MEINKATIGIIAAACITTGAAGAYLATRSARPAVAATGSSLAEGVGQSEAVIPDTPPAPAVEPPAATVPVARRAAAVRSTPRVDAVRAAEPPARAPEEPRPVVQDTQAPAALEPVQPLAPAPVVSEDPPAARFEDLVVSADSVLGLQMETSLTSERARVEDEVVARVTRDVRVGDRVAIPAGSKARGEVTLVERGGRVRDRARLGIRFTSVVFADGTRLPIETDTIYREGDGPGGESATKIGGGAIGGAILGGIFGGRKGAAIGATAGAGAGTAAVMAGGRNAATLASGTPVTVRLVKPATVTIDVP